MLREEATESNMHSVHGIPRVLTPNIGCCVLTVMKTPEPAKGADAETRTVTDTITNLNYPFNSP